MKGEGWGEKIGNKHTHGQTGGINDRSKYSITIIVIRRSFGISWVEAQSGF